MCFIFFHGCIQWIAVQVLSETILLRYEKYVTATGPNSSKPSSVSSWKKKDAGYEGDPAPVKVICSTVADTMTYMIRSSWLLHGYYSWPWNNCSVGVLFVGFFWLFFLIKALSSWESYKDGIVFLQSQLEIFILLNSSPSFCMICINHANHCFNCDCI